jgi:hypothetical protein
MSNQKRGDAIIVKISPRIAERAPCLEWNIGGYEWFIVKSNGPIQGIRAVWELNPLIELKILEDEIIVPNKHEK